MMFLITIAVGSLAAVVAVIAFPVVIAPTAAIFTLHTVLVTGIRPDDKHGLY